MSITDQTWENKYAQKYISVCVWGDYDVKE